MKKLTTFLCLVLLLLLQNFTEAISYQLYRSITNDTNFAKLIELIFRYLIYRFALTVLPYTLLTILSLTILPRRLIILCLLSGVVNFAVAAFLGLVVEGKLIFDSLILLFSALSSVVIMLWIYFVFSKNKPMFHKVIEGL